MLDCHGVGDVTVMNWLLSLQSFGCVRMNLTRSVVGWLPWTIPTQGLSHVRMDSTPLCQPSKAVMSHHGSIRDANALILTTALRSVWILWRSLSPKRTVIRQSALPSKHSAPARYVVLLEAVAQLELPVERVYGTALPRGSPLSHW